MIYATYDLEVLERNIEESHKYSISFTMNLIHYLKLPQCHYYYSLHFGLYTVYSFQKL